MYAILRRALVEIDAAGRRRLALLGVVMSGAAILDVVGVGSIIPFTTLLIDGEAAAANPQFARLMRWTGAQSARELTVHLGLATVAFLVLVNALQVWTVWLLVDFTSQQGRLLSERLLASYLGRPYAWFLPRNTSDLLNTLFQEIIRVVGNVLEPALTIIARGTAAACLLVFLVYLNPLVALLATLLLGGAYAILYRLVRPLIARAGRQALAAREVAHHVATEALVGIKDVKLNGTGGAMLQRFRLPAGEIAHNEALGRVLVQAPRYLIETLALASFIIAATALASAGKGATTLPLIAAYAFAGYRLMPSLQQIYAGLAQLRYNVASLENVLRELAPIAPAGIIGQAPPVASPAASPFRECRVDLQGLEFRYPGSEAAVIAGVDVVLEPRTAVAIIGQTGSGKTTLIDLILGLLEPTGGRILVDGIRLDPANIAAWQSHIGYVPQTLFLTDDTIAANIAFGVPPADIDMARVVKAARAAQLDDLIATRLEQGYQTRVGERGSRLSNGQRQRIGIARALYRNPRLLVLDEATSALDYETEEMIMQSVGALARELTIVIIAHRLHTIDACDRVYQMRNGRLELVRTRAGSV